ncbi:MAG TPA: aldolase/citrate lyase family protein [Bryobacteraceae bacterium]|jgi:2-dehydro-3-deoxyglucarate aldolase/4-hydroxy-2-oxoheptanedioate aldolase
MTGLRKRLHDGEVVLGQMVLELFTSGIGPMLASAGMEFVIYDMEHGRCDLALLAEMVASCRGSNIVPLARVPDIHFQPLSRVLDIGARGVMVPRVETRAQAEDVVAQLKYAPEGRRGVALGIAHDLYRGGGAEFFEEANADTVVILLLETAKAFENLDDIVSVPGVDVAWMGHYDFTVSMGIPAQFEHPLFLDAMESLAACCRRHKVAPGFLPATPESAAHWIRKGFRAISLGSDVGVFLHSMHAFRQSVLDGVLTGGALI